MKNYKILSKLNGKICTTCMYANDTEDIHAELEPIGHRIYVIEEILSGETVKPVKVCPDCGCNKLQKDSGVTICLNVMCDYRQTE